MTHNTSMSMSVTNLLNAVNESMLCIYRQSFDLLNKRLLIGTLDSTAEQKKQQQLHIL